MMIYLLTFLTALLISAGLTPLAMRLGLRLGMVDRPGGRRRHRGEVARTGGLALFGGVYPDRAVDADPAPHFAPGLGGLVSSPRTIPKRCSV